MEEEISSDNDMLEIKPDKQRMSIYSQMKRKKELILPLIREDVRNLEQSVFILDTENTYKKDFIYSFSETYEWTIMSWKDKQYVTILSTDSAEIVMNIIKFIDMYREKDKDVLIYIYGQPKFDEYRLNSAFDDCKVRMPFDWYFIDVYQIIKKITNTTLVLYQSNPRKLIFVQNRKLKTVHKYLLGFRLLSFQDKLCPSKHRLKSVTDVFNVSDILTILTEISS